MKSFNVSQLCMLLAAMAGIGIFWYLGYRQTEPGNTQPRYEGEAVTAGLSGVFQVFEHLNTGDHYFHPGYCTTGQTVGFTPHRYPVVSGGNITTLIHQGFDSLRYTAPQDGDWLEQPPGSEVL
jgi:hypothetical protein